jgi:hypothetical protein
MAGRNERLKWVKRPSPVNLPHHQAITVLQPPQQGTVERPIDASLPSAFSCTMLTSGTPAAPNAEI